METVMGICQNDSVLTKNKQKTINESSLTIKLMINESSLNAIVNLFIMDHLVTSVGLQMFFRDFYRDFEMLIYCKSNLFSSVVTACVSCCCILSEPDTVKVTLLAHCATLLTNEKTADKQTDFKAF